MKRILYTKGRKVGTIVSSRNIRSSSTGALYRVTIDTINMTFKIYNINSERIAKRGGGVKTVQTLKINAKRALIQLGVKFDIEIRRTGGKK